MQLGARWNTGSAPHRIVPQLLHTAISEQEALHPAADSWTLTWLEGRPRCVLDDTVFVGLDAHGRVRVGPVQSAAAGGAAAGSAAAGTVNSPNEDPEEDDDWLS